VKIAFVYDAIHPYVVGGVQKRNWEIATRLVKRGHEVTLFGMKYWKGDNIVFTEGVRLWGVCPSQELYTNGRRSIREAICFAYKVFPSLFKETFDVIDVANFPYFPCLPAKLTSSFKKCPLVVTWHEVWRGYWYEYLGPLGIFGQIVERGTALLTNNVVANSAMTKRDLGKLVGAKDITVIPNGVDIAHIDRITPSPERTDILFAGRLIKEKNVDLLIRSIGVIRENSPAIRCLIIGDGPEREELERLAEDLDLVSNIRFTGFIENYEEVLAWMKSSKVFVLPSVREGFGIVALEANACGLPVVTVNHPQNAVCDLVVDRETGFIAELSEGDIAAKVLLAIEHKEQWSSNCKAIAQAYDWEEIATRTETYYRDMFGLEHAPENQDSRASV